jgi:hypothetical protein
VSGLKRTNNIKVNECRSKANRVCVKKAPGQQLRKIVPYVQCKLTVGQAR